MSVYVDEDTFTRFFGTTIMSTVRNTDDLQPLLTVLRRFPEIKVVSNLHIRILNVFSQTLASFSGDECKAIKKWYEDHPNTYYNPYQYLAPEVIRPIHYEAKNLLNGEFPEEFKNISTKSHSRITIENNKVVLKIHLDSALKKQLKDLVYKLNELYGVNRKVCTHIVLGYLKNSSFSFTENDKKLLNSLIPTRIQFNDPDVYQHSNMDTYRDFSYGMY